ncbi:MAG TPA: winged helix DNA-binding domain-containing protein [Pseudonocardiaceae bacterium]|nr:winged helix DNA-binding domain-containing protein [Pseudonocardiaceae bacterium]
MTWTVAAIRAARTQAQLLGDDRSERVTDLLDTVIAVQAQDFRPARLAVRVRSGGLVASDVDTACRDGAAVRTWLMRGTLHMVRRADIRWLLRLFGTRNADRYAGRRAQLGLDDDLCQRALAALPAVLRDGPLERAAIIEALAEEGVAIDPSGQAPAHLLMLAASRGILCRGPETHRDEPTYVLLDDWVPRTDDDDEQADLRRLATRYVAAHGPTAPADLATWSGLPVGTAKRAFAAADLVEIDSAIGPLAVLPGHDQPPPNRPSVRLLGHFDGYLLGYRDRSLTVDPAHQKQVQAGGGFIMPTVLVDGHVVATWRTTRGGVELAPFDRLTDRAARGVRGEIADLGRFLGKQIEWDASRG